MRSALSKSQKLSPKLTQETISNAPLPQTVDIDSEQAQQTAETELVKSASEEQAIFNSYFKICSFSPIMSSDESAQIFDLSKLIYQLANSGDDRKKFQRLEELFKNKVTKSEFLTKVLNFNLNLTGQMVPIDLIPALADRGIKKTIVYALINMLMQFFNKNQNYRNIHTIQNNLSSMFFNHITADYFLLKLIQRLATYANYKKFMDNFLQFNMEETIAGRNTRIIKAILSLNDENKFNAFYKYQAMQPNFFEKTDYMEKLDFLSMEYVPQNKIHDWFGEVDLEEVKKKEPEKVLTNFINKIAVLNNIREKFPESYQDKKTNMLHQYTKELIISIHGESTRIVNVFRQKPSPEISEQVKKNIDCLLATLNSLADIELYNTENNFFSQIKKYILSACAYCLAGELSILNKAQQSQENIDAFLGYTGKNIEENILDYSIDFVYNYFYIQYFKIINNSESEIDRFWMFFSDSQVHKIFPGTYMTREYYDYKKRTSKQEPKKDSKEPQDNFDIAPLSQEDAAIVEVEDSEKYELEIIEITAELQQILQNPVELGQTKVAESLTTEVQKEIPAQQNVTVPNKAAVKKKDPKPSKIDKKINDKLFEPAWEVIVREEFNSYIRESDKLFRVKTDHGYLYIAWQIPDNELDKDVFNKCMQYIEDNNIHKEHKNESIMCTKNTFRFLVPANERPTAETCIKNHATGKLLYLVNKIDIHEKYTRRGLPQVRREEINKGKEKSKPAFPSKKTCIQASSSQ